MEDIRLGEIVEGYVNGFLHSGGLGPCTAIAVYNPSKKRIYGCHVTSPESENLLGRLDKSIKKIGPSKDCIIYIAGNGVDSSLIEEFNVIAISKRNKDYIEQAMSKYNFKDVFIRWNGMDVGSSFTIDTKTGYAELTQWDQDSDVNIYQGRFENAPIMLI